LNVRILHLMSIGQTHEEIAQRLERAAQTVRNRMSNMIQRAGVRNHTELVITYEQAIARQAILIESTSS
jgi:DNA-binding NarL/FixJ family response regulator